MLVVKSQLCATYLSRIGSGISNILDDANVTKLHNHYAQLQRWSVDCRRCITVSRVAAFMMMVVWMEQTLHYAVRCTKPYCTLTYSSVSQQHNNSFIVPSIYKNDLLVSFLLKWYCEYVIAVVDVTARNAINALLSRNVCIMYDRICPYFKTNSSWIFSGLHVMNRNKVSSNLSIKVHSSDTTII